MHPFIEEDSATYWKRSCLLFLHSATFEPRMIPIHGFANAKRKRPTKGINMHRIGLSLFAVIALAGCANGPGASHPVQDPTSVTKEHQREEEVNSAQAEAERYKSQVVLCQKAVAETHELLDAAVSKAQELYRESAPAIKQGAIDGLKAGSVWVQKKLEENTTTPASQ